VEGQVRSVAEEAEERVGTVIKGERRQDEGCEKSAQLLTRALA
jgi:hypothetical protein